MLKLPVYPNDLLNDSVISEIGPWSAYGLAETALKYYFPDEYDGDKDDDGIPDGVCIGGIQKESELLQKLGCNYWHDLVQKYQREVGYKHQDGFNINAVNQY